MFACLTYVHPLLIMSASTRKLIWIRWNQISLHELRKISSNKEQKMVVHADIWKHDLFACLPLLLSPIQTAILYIYIWLLTLNYGTGNPCEMISDLKASLRRKWHHCSISYCITWRFYGSWGLSWINYVKEEWWRNLEMQRPNIVVLS